MSALNGGNISKVTRIYGQAIVAVAAKFYHSVCPFRIDEKCCQVLYGSVMRRLFRRMRQSRPTRNDLQSLAVRRDHRHGFWR
jgi:hypothetical protein